MTGPGDIDSWFEFIIWSILAVAVFIGATSGVIGMVKAHKNGAATGEIKEQVQNSHATNLRDDIDDLDSKVDQVDTKVDRLGGMMDALQSQMSAFMRETRAQQARQDLIAAKYHPEER